MKIETNLLNAKIFFANVYSRFSGERCLERSAGLSFYAVFAIPALMYLLFRILAAVLSLGYASDDASGLASGFIRQQASQLISEASLETEIDRFMAWKGSPTSHSRMTVVSFLGIILSATGIVSALQDSLNRVWQTPAKTGSISITFLFHRVFSVGMLIGLALLLTVSFFISTSIESLFATAFPLQRDEASGVVLQLATTGFSFVSQLIVVFLVFYILPDANVLAFHALAGALATNLFFVAGRLGLEYQILSGQLFAQFGSAASLLLILLWLYYSFVSLHLGACIVAELTQSVNNARGIKSQDLI